jgi:polyhydroxybutyrate depolymerase
LERTPTTASPLAATVALDVPVGTRLRSALACLPPGGPPAAGWPLVIAFHGGQSHPEMMRRFSGLDVLAACGRAVVVYPAGTGSRESLLTWNGGNCCGEALADGSADVDFVRQLIVAVAGRLPIDAARIHATGMSNGAMMAYRAGAELAGQIASIAPVAGPLALASIAPVRAVPVLHFHGTLDQFTPLEGGIGRRSVTRVSHRPVLEGVLEWAHANGCPAESSREVIPCSDDGITIERFTWGPGRSGSEVVLYRLEGGGHTWPGRKPDSFLLGPSASSLDANQIIWEFFNRHPLETVVGERHPISGHGSQQSGPG